MKTTFEAFQNYCIQAATNLNQCESYQAKYRIIEHPFAKQHDAQYLEVINFGDKHIVKINLCYSIAYQIATFYFMVYDQNSQPLKVQHIYSQYLGRLNSQEQLDPANQEKGIYLSQNPITKEYFYTLHQCQMQMDINYLVPFYFGLLGLNPPLIIKTQNQ